MLKLPLGRLLQYFGFAAAKKRYSFCKYINTGLEKSAVDQYAGFNLCSNTKFEISVYAVKIYFICTFL